jgi:lambda repressor-like predicted transcriptional regulator
MTDDGLSIAPDHPVRRAREEQGWTLQDLSNATATAAYPNPGKSKSMLSNTENWFLPKYGTRRLLALALGKTTQELWPAVEADRERQEATNAN